jgi:hypothetical protein
MSYLTNVDSLMIKVVIGGRRSVELWVGRLGYVCVECDCSRIVVCWLE